MIRILYDEYGNGRSDIILKIDMLPTYVLIADTFYLKDFLRITDTKTESIGGTDSKPVKEIVINFVEYLRERLLNVGKPEVFVPFDISDEYLCGLLVSRERDLFSVKIGYTSMIQGYEIDKDSLDTLISERMASYEYEENGEWIIPLDKIQKGFEQSLERLRK